MFRFAQYSSQRDTGIPWCPKVPSHWDTPRNKTVMVWRAEPVGAFSGEYQLLSLTKLGVVTRDLSTGKGKIPASFENYQRIRSGDMVMCLFDVDETPRTVGRARQDGMITGAYERFVATGDTLAEYLNWFYIAMDNTKALRPLYRGLRKTIPVEEFLASHVPTPPLNEQAAIVKYLAHANARINKAIAAKRRLIAFLEEQKVAVVNSVIRADWPRIPIKRALRSVTAGSWGAAVEESNDPVKWCVRVADFDYSSGGVADSPKTYRAISDREFSRRSLRRGDLLLEGSGGGEKTPVGRVVLFDYDDDAVCSNFLQRLRSSDDVESEFLMLMLRRVHMSGEVRRYIKQTTGIQNLDLHAYLTHRIPMPSVLEQRRVVSDIQSEFREVDTVVSRIHHEIGLLQEFRVRLVADVVTGQVDVRAVAATLPDFAEAAADVAEENDPMLGEELAEVVAGDDE